MAPAFSPPKFTTAHYEAVAQVFNEAHVTLSKMDMTVTRNIKMQMVDDLMDLFINMFMADNPRFNITTFIHATLS